MSRISSLSNIFAYDARSGEPLDGLATSKPKLITYANPKIVTNQPVYNAPTSSYMNQQPIYTSSYSRYDYSGNAYGYS
jgi:hypothetical protein